MMSSFKNLFRRRSMSSQLLADDRTDFSEGPETDYDQASIWTVEKDNSENEAVFWATNSFSRQMTSDSLYLDQEMDKKSNMKLDDGKGRKSDLNSVDKLSKYDGKMYRGYSVKEEINHLAEEKEVDTMNHESDKHNRKESYEHTSVKNKQRKAFRFKKKEIDSKRKVERSNSSECDADDDEDTDYPRHERKISADSNPEGNWTLKSEKKEKKEKKGEYLKITIEDLQQLIRDNVATAVSNIPKGYEVEMKKMDIRRNSLAPPPDVDNTDSETGQTFSSGNSMDLLLPEGKLQSAGASLHLVNPTRVGILKRFLPYTVEESESSNSNVTMETFLSSNRQGRRRSLQPDLLRQYADRNRKDLFRQSALLKGNTFNHRMQDREQHTSRRMSDYPNPYKSDGRRMSRRCITFDIDSTDSDNMSIDDDCRACHDKRLSRCHCSEPRYTTRRPSCATLSHSIATPHMPDGAVLYTDRGLIPQVQQLPQIMVSAPSVPTSQAPVPTSGTNVEPQADILKQIQDALKDTQKAKDQESDKQTDTDTGSVKEDNPFARIQAKLEERKKKQEEEKPILIAKVCSIMVGVLFLLAGGAVGAVGVYNMVIDTNAIFTDVSEAAKGDEGFMMFCFALMFVCAVVLVAWVCLCCGAIKLRRCCLKSYIIAVTIMILIQISAVGLLYIMRADAVSIPLLSVIIAQLRQIVTSYFKDVVTFQYLEGSAVMKAWDKLQIMAQCCGFESPADYETSSWRNKTRLSDPKQVIPDTCCKLKALDVDNPEPMNKLLCQTLTPGFSHERGCLDALVGWYSRTSVMALSVTAALVVVEILCIICVIRLCKMSEQRKSRKKEELAKEKTQKTNEKTS